MAEISQILDYLDDIGQSPVLQVAGATEIKQPCSLDHPVEGGLCFYRAKRWQSAQLDLDLVGLLLVEKVALGDEIESVCQRTNTTLAVVDNSRLSFMKVVESFFQERPSSGTHPTASIGFGSEVHPSCSIGANVAIGASVVIGPDTVIDANVTIGDRSQIGRSCYVAPGAAIGQPGFGYERDESGVLVQFPHLGRVVIGDEVHVGANTCIDRGTLDDTVIGDRVRIDNLCHISHNVWVQEDTAVIANSMIAGSVTVGRGSWIAPSASIINGIELGDRVTVGMGAVVTKPVGDDQVVAGSPAVPIAELKATRARLNVLLAENDSTQVESPK